MFASWNFCRWLSKSAQRDLVRQWEHSEQILEAFFIVRFVRCFTVVTSNSLLRYSKSVKIYAFLAILKIRHCVLDGLQAMEQVNLKRLIIFVRLGFKDYIPSASGFNLANRCS